MMKSALGQRIVNWGDNREDDTLAGRLMALEIK